MTKLDSGELSKSARNLLQRSLDGIVDQALAGVGPLRPVSELAAEYRGRSYANDQQRVKAVIRWATVKNATTGFVTGLGGALVLPVTIPGAVTASLAIQASMIGTIAEVYGHDSKDDHVRTTILLCMVGTGVEDITKRVAASAGEKLAIEGLKVLPGRVLIEINKKVGFRLLTKFGERGVVNLVKIVPVVGGVVGGAFDATTCYAVGKVAERIFRPPAPYATSKYRPKSL